MKPVQNDPVHPSFKLLPAAPAFNPKPQTVEIARTGDTELMERKWKSYAAHAGYLTEILKGIEGYRQGGR